MRACAILFLGLAGFGASALPNRHPSEIVPEPASRPEITLKATAYAKPGNLVVLEPEAVKNARVVWNLNGPEKFTQWKEENGKLFLAMPAYQVSFSLIVIPTDDPNAPLKNIRYILNVQGDEIEPEPEPAGRFLKTDFLVLIHDAESRPAYLAKMINSKFWQQEMEAAGFNQILIHDDASEEGKAFIETAAKLNQPNELPFFAVMDENGNFKKSFKSPENLDQLKEVAGL